MIQSIYDNEKMEKNMAKFIARYIKLITVLYIIVSAGAIVLLSEFKVLEPVYIWLIFLMATFGFFIAIFCIQSRYQKRIDAEFLNTCNPQKYVEFYTLCYKGNPQNAINQISKTISSGQFIPTVLRTRKIG